MTQSQLILLDAVTSTGHGPSVGIQGSGYNPNPQRDRTFAATIVLDGGGAAATATVLIEDSTDGSSYSTIGSFALSTAGGQVGPESNSVSPASSPFLFTTRKKYIRASLSAVTGSTPTVNALAKLLGGD